eukprot:6294-Heterococcus_DN1.PRE.3
MQACSYEHKRKATADASESHTTAAKQQRGSDQHSSKKNGILLQRGMVLLRSYLTIEQQQALAQQVTLLGQSAGGFYDCNNEKTKTMRMMNLGKSTAAPYKDHVLSIPVDWHTLAADITTAAIAVDASLSDLRLQPVDVCVVNHYTSSSKLGWHQDKVSKRDARIPVISISLGDTGIFQYRNGYSKKHKVKEVALCSGDVLIFGGKSRDILHQVSAIEPAVSSGSSDSSSTVAQNISGSISGRYNINFREL